MALRKVREYFFRLLTWPRRSPIFAFVTGLTLVIAALVFLRPMIGEVLELKLYDLKFRFRGTVQPGKELAIVTIDDESVKKIGRWPWSRKIMAQLLQRLQEAGPKVIALDIIFAESEETQAVATIKELRQEISQNRLASPPLLGLLAAKERQADVDRQLAKVIGQEPPTILGLYFTKVGGTASGLKASRFMSPDAVRASTYNIVRWMDERPTKLPILEARDVELNLTEITDAAKGGGYFNIIPDIDGTVRRHPLAILYGSDLYMPLAIATLRQYLGRQPAMLTMSRLGVAGVRLGRRQVPVDSLGRLLINYYGPPGLFKYYSAAQLLDGTVPKEALKDKIVLVGATAVGIYDLRVTPFSGVAPGVEIQATVIDNILEDNFLKAPSFPQFQSLLLVLALGLVLGLVLPRLSAVWSLLVTVLVLGIFIGGNFLLFVTRGWQVELIYPLLQIGGVYVGVTVQRFLREERERLRIKKTFQAYVAPEVVNEILKNPDKLGLGGDRRDITILFTDIRGFTTLAETLEPEALVELLHSFFDPMSEIIVEYGGTIDKYMGDAIMALFGAPIENPGHAQTACRAALAMVAKLEALSAEWRSQGRPDLRIGVGINSGEAVVGNMGSQRLFDYTAVGDNVNLASRLEGLNKYYQTSILISNATAAHLDGGFILREVDVVQVKGKKEPLKVFEILGEGTPDPELAKFLGYYQEGRSLFLSRHWQESGQAFQAALELRSGDVPTRNYLELSHRYLAAPPDLSWRGIRTYEEK
jgi:adenylate cyclase